MVLEKPLDITLQKGIEQVATFRLSPSRIPARPARAGPPPGSHDAAHTEIRGFHLSTRVVVATAATQRVATRIDKSSPITAVRGGWVRACVRGCTAARAGGAAASGRTQAVLGPRSAILHGESSSDVPCGM